MLTKGQDIDAVRLMAAAPNAIHVQHHYPLLVELRNEPNTNQLDLTRTIQENLSRGTAVLVRGWEPRDLIKLTLDDVSMYRHPITEPLQWQGVYMCVHARPRL